MVDLKAEPCDCADGKCQEFCDPASDCVNRIARLGEVKIMMCDSHIGYSWHLSGKCLKCEAMKDSDKDSTTLIMILTKMREALGVDDKLMLTELPNEAQKVKEHADNNTIVVGEFCFYRRNGSLWLRHDSGEAIGMNSANEKKFEQMLAKFFKAIF